MNRKGSIGVAAAAAGILIAGATASVAVFSASQAVPEPEAITLVVDASAANAVAAAPIFEPGPLPEIVIASAVPEAASSISAATAKRLVLAEVPGTFVSVTKATRGGFPSFAVTVKRADGSTVTGYVDQTDGVIHDWTQTAAPAPAYNDEEYDEEEEGSEYEESDHDGDDD